MPIFPTLQAPVAELLAQIALVLREGVSGWIRPSPFAAPYWADWDTAHARTGAPAGHWIFEEGTKMYLDHHREEVVAPYCDVALNGDPVPLNGNVPSAYWRVPVQVDMVWTRDTTEALRDKLAMLAGILSSDYPAVGSMPAQLLENRLTNEFVQVYGPHAITDFKPEPLQLIEGHPLARFSATYLCSALFDYCVIPNQATNGTLAAADFADRFTAFKFLQSTSGRTITLAGPTAGSGTITITNAGAVAFTLDPGAITIGAESDDTDYEWNGSAWVAA